LENKAIINAKLVIIKSLLLHYLYLLLYYFFLVYFGVVDSCDYKQKILELLKGKKRNYCGPNVKNFLYYQFDRLKF